MSDWEQRRRMRERRDNIFALVVGISLIAAVALVVAMIAKLFG